MSTSVPPQRDRRAAPVGAIATEDRDTVEFLHGVLRCDVVALVVVEGTTATVWATSWRASGDGVVAERQVGGWPTCGAVVRPLRADAAQAWPGGVELLPGPPPVCCRLAVPLVVGPDRTVAWCLGREEGDFSPAEVELATVLVPGLRLRLERAAARVRQPLPEALTVREQAVLELIALGMTSRAVAHRFHISERTVHKHLEHIYRKTGCGDRLSAVRRVREAGLIPL